MTSDTKLIEQDIERYLEEHQHKGMLRFLTCGSVDDGKSTLIGRLLMDAKAVYEDQLAALKRDSERHGSAGKGVLDPALFLDGLEDERQQGITIDVAYRFFSTKKRKFIIADTPGHEQYTRNMATGASNCDLAIILVDARHGVLPQTKRHSFIVSLLGIKHVVVAINKMDLMDYSQEVFDQIVSDYTDFSAKLTVRDVHFIPISALHGDNVAHPSEHMDWYRGGCLLNYLETVHLASDKNLIDMRFPVQTVLRPDLNFRGFAGTVASGVMRPGDRVAVMPSMRESRIKSIVTLDGEQTEAHPPQAVTVTLEDEVDVSRGDMLCHPQNLAHQSSDVEAMVIWMDDKPMKAGKGYLIKHTTRYVPGEIAELRYKIDVNTLHKQDADELQLNEIGRVHLVTNRPLYFDEYQRNQATGNFIIIDRMTNGTVGAGMILKREVSGGGAKPAEKIVARTQKQGQVSADERAMRFQHKAVTLWFTGLPKAGKSTLAYALEKHLFDMGCAVHVLDGLVMREGLSQGLGFSGADRSENARRAAEVARIGNRAGLITVAAFVTPSAEDRAAVRKAIGPGGLVEVYLNAPLDVCEGRDDEGLYAKARAGELKNFTGVDAPYEAPTSPDLVVPTHELSVEDSVERIVRYLRQEGYIQQPADYSI